MFQCIGLGTVEDGGCGEDWWHPECIVGLPRDWHQKRRPTTENKADESNTVSNGHTQDDTPATQEHSAAGGGNEQEANNEDDDSPMPPGFPAEDDFEHFICYKCVGAFPWIKRFAGTEGFLPGLPYVPHDQTAQTNGTGDRTKTSIISKKRKSDEIDDDASSSESQVKRQKGEEEPTTNGVTKQETTPSATMPPCSYEKLPPAPTGRISLFLKENFRSHLCRCSTHFPLLKPHPALLDNEPTYSPPLSRSSSPAPGSVGSRSLLERGEAALSNVDRVRAIEGVMVYNHLRDKVKDFLRPYAETGQPVGAEDIKQYFERLRGDQEAIKQAGNDAAGDNDGTDGGGDSRREQSGKSNRSHCRCLRPLS